MAAARSRWGKVFAPQCKPFPTCWNSVKAPPVTSLDFYQELFLRQPVCVFLVILFQSLYSNEERFYFHFFIFMFCSVFSIPILQCVWGNVLFSLSMFLLHVFPHSCINLCFKFMSYLIFNFHFLCFKAYCHFYFTFDLNLGASWMLNICK